MNYLAVLQHPCHKQNGQRIRVHSIRIALQKLIFGNINAKYILLIFMIWIIKSLSQISRMEGGKMIFWTRIRLHCQPTEYILLSRLYTNTPFSWEMLFHINGYCQVWNNIGGVCSSYSHIVCYVIDFIHLFLVRTFAIK